MLSSTDVKCTPSSLAIFRSDYALNKFSEGIVYQFSDRTLEISLEDFLRDNPGKTEADFMALKRQVVDLPGGQRNKIQP